MERERHGVFQDETLSPFSRGDAEARRILALLILAACAEVPVPPVVVRDSLGITIIENNEGAWAEGTGWRIDSLPSLTMLGAGETRPRVAGAARLSDGRIVVVDSVSRELRFHDGTSGVLLGRAGSPGRGPGQFSAPGDLHVGAGDTLYVWDNPWRGLVVFDAMGTHVRTERVGRAERVRNELFAWGELRPPLLGSPRSLIENGLFEAADSVSGFAVVARLRLEFDRTDTLVTFVTSPFTHLGDRVVIATGAHEEETFVGRVRTREFLRFEGVHLRRIVRTSAQPLPFESAEAGEEVETRPLYTSLFADRTGAVWMRLHGRNGDGDPWIIFDDDGREMGELLLPSGFEPMDAGPDWLLGVDRDAGGAERVMLLRVRRS